MAWWSGLVAIFVAYLLGSIPVGVVAARRLANVDITGIGSGHTGGTNVLRAAGITAGVITVVGDLLKGLIAILAARHLFGAGPWIEALAGVASVVGHNYSIFLRGKGGVGSMTSGGAGFVLVPLGTWVSMFIGVVLLLVTRISSVASLAFAILLPVAVLVGVLIGYWHVANLVFALLVGALSVWALRNNIKRLLAGTERKLGQKIKPGDSDVSPPSEL